MSKEKHTRAHWNRFPSFELVSQIDHEKKEKWRWTSSMDWRSEWHTHREREMIKFKFSFLREENAFFLFCVGRKRKTINWASKRDFRCISWHNSHRVYSTLPAPPVQKSLRVSRREFRDGYEWRFSSSRWINQSIWCSLNGKIQAMRRVWIRMYFLFFDGSSSSPLFQRIQYG